MAEQWRPDLEEATGDVILLTKGGRITSGLWRPRTRCWWVFGGGALYPDQVAGWLPRDALPEADNG